MGHQYGTLSAVSDGRLIDPAAPAIFGMQCVGMKCNLLACNAIAKDVYTNDQSVSIYCQVCLHKNVDCWVHRSLGQWGRLAWERAMVTDTETDKVTHTAKIQSNINC